MSETITATAPFNMLGKANPDFQPAQKPDAPPNAPGTISAFIEQTFEIDRTKLGANRVTWCRSVKREHNTDVYQGVHWATT